LQQSRAGHSDPNRIEKCREVECVSIADPAIYGLNYEVIEVRVFATIPIEGSGIDHLQRAVNAATAPWSSMADLTSRGAIPEGNRYLRDHLGLNDPSASMPHIHTRSTVPLDVPAFLPRDVCICERVSMLALGHPRETKSAR
jgi:hypothetical protein